MEETYCLKDKRYTPCVEPRGYQKDKRGRTQFFFIVHVLFVVVIKLNM